MDANKKICLDAVSMRLLCSLKSERLRRGLTQKELGVKIGVDRGNYQPLRMWKEAAVFVPSDKTFRDIRV